MPKRGHSSSTDIDVIRYANASFKFTPSHSSSTDIDVIRFTPPHSLTLARHSSSTDIDVIRSLELPFLVFLRHSSSTDIDVIRSIRRKACNPKGLHAFHFGKREINSCLTHHRLLFFKKVKVVAHRYFSPLLLGCLA